MTIRRKKIIGITCGVLCIIAIIVLCLSLHKDSNTKKELEYGTSEVLSYEDVVEEYQKTWDISEMKARRELDSVEISDVNEENGQYKIIWIKMPAEDDDSYEGYMQVLCQVGQSKEENIEEVLAVAFGAQDNKALEYFGRIKIWWREDDLEFVCNGYFGNGVGEKSGLQSVHIKEDEKKDLSWYENKLLGESHNYYSHQTIQI